MKRQFHRMNVLPEWRPRSLRAFTLIELLIVIAIIGILASIAMPAIKGLGTTSDTGTAVRQLTDEIGFARLRAINDRTTVYMVFVPPTIISEKWNNLDKEEQAELDKVINGQYTMYALFARRTLGDQPGPGTARYLTEWRELPRGVFITTNEFNVLPLDTWKTTNPTNRPLPYMAVPFPLARSKTEKLLPCIAFNYQGQLQLPYGDQFLHFSRGSVNYPKDTAGKYRYQFPQVVETPKSNWVRNPYIRIDWVTGRPRTVQPQPPQT